MTIYRNIRTGDETVRRRAGVSRSLVYADPALKARIIELRARRGGAGHAAPPLPARSIVSERSLRNDLALAQAGNRALRNDLDVRELGRVVRTQVLLRYLSEPALRETITAITNRVEAFHGFAGWLGFGAEDGVIAHNDPVYQEKLVQFNQLITNCALYSTAADITTVVNELVSHSHRVDPVDLATISPLITHTIRRFGDWHLDLTPPEPAGDVHLAIPIPTHPHPFSRGEAISA
jgi:hypothetical protein